MDSALYLPSLFPKLIAFDLDGTLWYPEMYQLPSGPPFTPVSDGKHTLLTKKKTKISLLGITGRIFDDLKSKISWKSTIIAWASCTDEPLWAKECLKTFRTSNGKSLDECCDISEIYQGNKKKHFKAIKEKMEKIDFEEMMFFDNQMDNIRNVGELGVYCVYCPEGLTREAWEEGLKGYEEKWKKRKEKL